MCVGETRTLFVPKEKLFGLWKNDKIRGKILVVSLLNVDDRPLQTMSEAERRAVLFSFYKTKPGRTKKMSELASLLRKVGVDGYGSLCRQIARKYDEVRRSCTVD